MFPCRCRTCRVRIRTAAIVGRPDAYARYADGQADERVEKSEGRTVMESSRANSVADERSLMGYGSKRQLSSVVRPKKYYDAFAFESGISYTITMSNWQPVQRLHYLLITAQDSDAQVRFSYKFSNFGSVFSVHLKYLPVILPLVTDSNVL